MQEIIQLNGFIYDIRAKDGTWCTLPYPGHKKGCPNFPACISKHPDILDFSNYIWYAIIEEFDLKAHAEDYLTRDWCKTMRQARCVLYWQRKVVNRLKVKALNFMEEEDILLEIPEASGVNIFATMSYHGLNLKATPDYVYKIMMVGKKQK